MPRILTLLVVILATLFAPRPTKAETTPDLLVPGVSKALAEYRYAHIFSVQYRLHFSIPAQGPISGHASITYELESPTDVILDFKASVAPTVTIPCAPITEKRCTAAESSKFVRYEGEHIIIPAALTTAGANSIAIQFTPDDQSFNRRDDLLYTLFVPDRARTAFPCFDQPDMKANFTLNLETPEGWKAVSNTAPVKTKTARGRTHITFAQSEPLPTYLFAFAAGHFTYVQHTAPDGRTIGAYHRETDPKRIAQLPEIFRQVEYSLRWQEDFTGVKYPFAKYDLVILPGFQFGGMEHTGATFYNDNTIFLNEHPTPDEVLSRANLIAHETTHMWFGDYVTMRWFDDVWTKEVFANYFAAEITAPQFPQVNHDLNRLKTYAAAAYSEDRTWAEPYMTSQGETLRGGGTAIRQPLENLRNAGLVYNNIIYNKAPLMMQKMVELMGRDAFREGIREYVKTYAYGNASWEDLVRILDRHSSANVSAFSNAWVNERGMPNIKTTLSRDVTLILTQSDPYERSLTWPQSFSIGLHTEAADTVVNITMTTQRPNLSIALPAKWSGAQLIPNVDGRGYGVFLLEEEQLASLLRHWQSLTTGTARQAVVMNLHENYLLRNISPEDWLKSLIASLREETDALTASTICAYLGEPLRRIALSGSDEFISSTTLPIFQRKAQFESELVGLSGSHPLTSVRLQLKRLLFHIGSSRATTQWMQQIWENANDPLLSERDYMALTYELALRRQAQAESILARGRERLLTPSNGGRPNADRLREFDFISRAVMPRQQDLDNLFAEMLTPEGRRIEPWAARVIAYLNHPLRGASSLRYIAPGLEALEDVQRTGDIFFPTHWCSALLGEHTSPEARHIVEVFLDTHPDYLPLRRNKILNAAYPLFR